MTHTALAHFSQWLSGTSLSQLIKVTGWLVPASQSIHIIAVALVFASTLMVSVRLWRPNAAPGPSILTLQKRFAPWVWVSLAVLLFTGLIQITAEPERSLPNAWFQAKMGLLLMVIAVTLAFQRFVRARQAAWDALPVPPPSARLMAMIAMGLWLAIIVCGRWIAYAAA